MRVFVAGATGVLGRASVQAFVNAGHHVTGVARAPDKAALLREKGAEPVSVDLFRPDVVADAVRGHDVVCNFATRIPVRASAYFRRSAWEDNDRLHREASRNLVDAALKVGASSYLQHSVGFMYADGGDRWLGEDSPLDVPPHGHAVVEAEAQARRFSETGGAGVGLRFGFFYGPLAPNARQMLQIARLGFAPLPGRPEARISWIHTDDLATSAVAALGAAGGIYNVVDDEPLTRAEWADVLARALGRKRIRTVSRVPLGKRYDYLQRSIRVSNARFKNATGWTPTVASGREGWLKV